jgi:hypothetical protein
MRAVQCEDRKIQPVFDGEDPVEPELFQTAILTPLAKLVVDGVVTDLRFIRIGGIPIAGEFLPLTSVCKT